MKNVFSFLLVLVISSSVHAKNNRDFLPQLNFEQKKTDFQNITRTFKKDSIKVLATNEANNLELWNFLNTNKDEFITKNEAVYSKEIMERWDELDSNKDGKLDFFDFSRLSNRES